MSNEIQTTSESDRSIVTTDTGDFANLLDSNRFNQLWRVARLFSESALVPAHFQGKPQDCFIASQMAMRLGVDPFMFMQNTYVTQGKPGMEGKLAIALVNSSGKFGGQLRFRLSGEGDDYGCVAYTTDKQTGEELTGPRVTIKVAKDEGWYSRNKKWQSIPDLMLQYRAGAWFGRLYCPERLMGMQTVDELIDESHTRAIEARVVGSSKLDNLPEPHRPANGNESSKPAGERVAPPPSAPETPRSTVQGPAADVPQEPKPFIQDAATDPEQAAPDDDGSQVNESYGEFYEAAEAHGQALGMRPSQFQAFFKACLTYAKKEKDPGSTSPMWRAEVMRTLQGEATRFSKFMPLLHPAAK